VDPLATEREERFRALYSDAYPAVLRAWLFGIARHCLLNTQRGDGRQGALTVRLASTLLPHEADDGHDLDAVAQRLDVARAWSRLSPLHQEALALSVFEDLTSPQAARVLGITAPAYATLSHILSTPPDAEPFIDLPGPRRSRRKLVLIPLAATGLAVGALVIPGVGHQSRAYASWTAKPTPISGKDLAPVEVACRKTWP